MKGLVGLMLNTAQNGKTKRLVYILVLVLTIAGLTLGTFFDVEIARFFAFEKTESGYTYAPQLWALIIEVCAEWLPYLIFAFGVSLASRSLCLTKELCLKSKKRRGKFILLKLLTFAVSSAGLYMMADSSAGYLVEREENINSLVCLAIALFSAAVIMLLVYFIKPATTKALAPASAFSAVSIALFQIPLTLMKTFWGRMRPRELAVHSFEWFSDWFVLCGNTGYRSFPSGHSSNTVICLIFLFAVVNIPGISEKAVKLITGLAWAWAVIVPISRLCCGAHFLSDISAGFLIGFVWLELSAFIFKKYYSTPK